MLRAKGIFASLLILSCLSVIPVNADNGLFSANAPVQPRFLNAIFAVDGSTITAIYRLGYEGDSTNFSWLIPVPDQPEKIEPISNWSSGAYSSDLEYPSLVEFVAPPDYCGHLFMGVQPFNMGSGAPEYADLAPSYEELSANRVTGWLDDNGYQEDERAQQIISQYSDEGMSFLALPTRTNLIWGEIQSPAITYNTDRLVLPLQLTAGIEVNVWIFANTQYVPENYAHPKVDLRHVYTPHRVMNPHTGESSDPNDNSYRQERIRALESYNGQAFITEYAGTSALFSSPGHESPIADFAARFPYVTHFYGSVPSAGVSTDPVFVPAPNAPDVSNVIDLNGQVDPLAYWGCSTRTAMNRQTFGGLPAGRTRIDDLGLTFAHPDGWQPSQFRVGDTAVYVLAPQRAALRDFQLAAAGTPTMPMLVAFRTQETEVGTFPSIDDLLLEAGTRPADRPNVVQYVENRFYPNTLGDVAEIALVTSNEDWAQNHTMYSSMLAYADALPYYLDSHLLYTLFLDGLAVGFPDGWIEQVDNQMITIQPGEDSGARVRVQPIAQRLGLEWIGEMVSPSRAFPMLDELVTDYGLANAEAIYGQYEASACPFQAPALPYEYDGRKGYLSVGSAYLVEISAPDAEFERDETLLSTIGKTLQFRFPCG